METHATHTPVPAPWARRVMAYLLDVLLFTLPGATSVWLAFPEAGRQALVDLVLAKRAAFDEIGITPQRALSGTIPFRSGAAMLLLSAWVGGWLLYRVVSAQRGVSVGKRLLSLRVVSHTDAGKLSRRGALRRVFPSSALGLLPVPGIGMVCYLAAVWSPDRRGWHDQAAGSRVVLVRGVRRSTTQETRAIDRETRAIDRE